MNNPGLPASNIALKLGRYLMALAIAQAIVLALGAGIERLPLSGLVPTLLSAQTNARTALDAVDPFTLGRLYLCSWSPPSEGDCLPEGSVAMPPLDKNLSLQERIQKLVLDPPDRPRTIGLGHWANGLWLPLTPFVALADLLWHLLFGISFVGSVFVLSQFALGYLLYSLIRGYFTNPKKSTDQDNDLVSVFLYMPVATILLGCGFAYLTKWVMIGGLEVFGSVVALAGLFSSATFMGVTGAEFVKSVAETAIHEKIRQYI